MLRVRRRLASRLAARAPCRDCKSAQDSVEETSSRRATEAAAGFLKLPLSASFQLIEIRKMRLNVET